MTNANNDAPRTQREVAREARRDTPPIRAYFSPWTDPRPCWFCHHYGGMTHEGSAARCVRSRAIRIAAQPAQGCAFWEREPGADDDLDWAPEGLRPAVRQTSALTQAD